MDKKIGTVSLNVIGNSQYVSVSRPTYDKEYQLCKQFLRLKLGSGVANKEHQLVSYYKEDGEEYYDTIATTYGVDKEGYVTFDITGKSLYETYIDKTDFVIDSSNMKYEELSVYFNDVELQKEWLTYGLDEAGVLDIDLITGRYLVNRTEMSTGGYKLPYTVGLTYKSTIRNGHIQKVKLFDGEIDYRSGYGWKINVEEYLVKQTMSSNYEGSNNYVYIDAQGFEHNLKEQYYYLDNEEKVIVEKEKIDVSSTGELSYTDSGNIKHIIFVACEDRTETSLIVDDFKGSEYSTELSWLKEQMESTHYIKVGNYYKVFSLSSIPNVYRMIGIIDLKGNKVLINYDNDKIESIVDADDKSIKFKYNNIGLLESLLDDEGNEIIYEYSGSLLTGVIKNGVKIAKYKYTNNYLLEAYDRSNIGFILTINGNSVKTLGIKNNDTTNKKDFYSFSYEYGYSASVYNVDTGVKTVCCFDLDKKVTNKYTIKNNISTAIQDGYQYRTSKKTYDVKVYGLSDNYIKNSRYSGNESIVPYQGTINTANSVTLNVSTDEVQQIKNHKTRNFVLSAWAKANSYYIDKRIKLDNSEEIIDNSTIYDSINQSRKFGLKVLATYVYDDKVIEEEHYCSFDCRQKDWQYLAFPVEINCNPEYSLTNIQIIFEYTSNKGVASLYGLKLCEGEWSYGNLYDNFRLSSLRNSRGDITSYNYNDSKLLTKVVTSNVKTGKDSEEVYRYDKYNRLVYQKDTNGLVCESEYDLDFIKKKEVYHESLPGVRYSNKVVIENGKEKQSINDFGELVYEYEYDGNITSRKDAEGNVVTVYEKDDKVLDIRGSVDGVSNGNSKKYVLGMLVEEISNGVKYSYEYDDFGRVERVKIDDEEYCNKSYDDVNHKETYNYASGEIVIVTNNYANNTRMVEYKENESSQSNTTTVTSDKYGNVISIIGKNKSESYEYGRYNQVSKKSIVSSGCSNIVMENEYDDSKNMVQSKVTIGDKNRVYNYEYQDERLSKIESNDIAQNIKYDAFGRVVRIKEDNITREYQYVTKGEKTSNLVSVERHIVNGIEVDRFEYSYNSLGMIIAVKKNGKLTVRYTYDGLNRIVREDNKLLGETVVYSYDENGNVISKEKGDYSLHDYIDGNHREYKYEGNKLIKCDENIIDYDVLGRPTSHNGNPLVWKNISELVSYGNVTYTYDMNGIRLSKAVGNVTTKYYLDGDRILAQDDGNYMEFIYGVLGVEGFTLLDRTYRYRKNILGDIIGIIDESNNEIVRYVYDAYGNHKVYLLSSDGYIECDYNIEYTDNSILDLYQTISKENPFRYRGYYFDTENNMYYLNSRYYDPSIGRFISPDSLKYLEPNVINGLNLYCYCMNDPIFYYDPSGKSVTLLPMFKILNLFIMISDRFVLKNKFDMHYEGSKDYGEGDAFIFSKDKIAIVDWEKSWYRGNLYFDKNEVYSGYFGVGNSSLYFGYNKKKKQIGFFADVNAFSAGYDGKYLDAGISVIGTGMIFAYEDGKVRIKVDPPGFIGVDISIDFSEIISDLW